MPIVKYELAEGDTFSSSQRDGLKAQISQMQTGLDDFGHCSGYPRVRMVGSFHELATTPFSDGVNAMCWPRKLHGDFAQLMRLLPPNPGISTVDESLLTRLSQGDAGRVAVDEILADLRALRDLGLSPNVDTVFGFEREPEPGPVSTEIYSFHADSATVEADTWLCTYHGASTELLRNEDAIPRIKVPETRGALLEWYGGREDQEFEDFLAEYCYDLHYVPRQGAIPLSFGIGWLWRIAIAWPGCPVPPCIHRAPESPPGSTPRLLLIS